MSYTCYAAVLIYNNQKFNNIRTNKNHDQGLRQGLSFKAKARTKDQTLKAKDRTKDWRLKAKDRTKDCQIVLKDNQGPRTKAKDNITGLIDDHEQFRKQLTLSQCMCLRCVCRLRTFTVTHRWSIGYIVNGAIQSS